MKRIAHCLSILAFTWGIVAASASAQSGQPGPPAAESKDGNKPSLSYELLGTSLHITLNDAGMTVDFGDDYFSFNDDSLSMSTFGTSRFEDPDFDKDGKPDRIYQLTFSAGFSATWHVYVLASSATRSVWAYHRYGPGADAWEGFWSEDGSLYLGSAIEGLYPIVAIAPGMPKYSIQGADDYFITQPETLGFPFFVKWASKGLAPSTDSAFYSTVENILKKADELHPENFKQPSADDSEGTYRWKLWQGVIKEIHGATEGIAPSEAVMDTYPMEFLFALNGKKDAAPAVDNELAVLELLSRWANSCNRLDLDEHMDSYLPKIDTYYTKHNISRDVARADKSAFLSEVDPIGWTLNRVC